MGMGKIYISNFFRTYARSNQKPDSFVGVIHVACFRMSITPTFYILIAKEMEKSIPEPSTYVGLLGIAALGGTGIIKRKTINSANLVLAGQSSHTKVES
ncbi:PEP-CTERM sorting domain-containing protein [Cuspidothrix issatschenkoi]|uniref:Ice-binding protein C-terminal domain-containing protein n=1 Tax=Cuspidothrix issatschenkoi CHARLIE-1 TaxID=2052836 RepID=A0A2S6CY74_9CYAN|nr:hypothetical protein CUN59_03275 [Cuspidothrix issatschenkoi CHARLIE-1]